MRNIFYNSEHYPDFTAGAAIVNVMREENRRRRRRRPKNRYPCKPREVPAHRPFEEVLGGDK
ncbi:MAG: hypothetical protein FWC27_15445 [Firmicutes bacterium]|nr:hypothetical protein [Bacillota bacterium]